ncbi:hypothetical protein EDD86DRAFT_212999 [Gorgonomyces haynaldii]|nr:hypothetical protein EDD86DRAFT_212999 [Gorgonomyces haynaldii]
MALPSYTERPGNYLFLSTVFHGISYCEASCCVALLLSKLLTDNTALKKPVFYLSCLSLAVNLVTQGAVTHAVSFLIHEPEESASDPRWQAYYKATQLIAVTARMPELFTHIVILLRMSAFAESKTIGSAILTGMIVIHGLCYIPTVIFGYMTMSQPAFYLAPTYWLWMITSGVCLLTHAAISIMAAVLFLGRIAAVMQIPPSEIMRSIMLRHEGLRWIILICMNVYYIFAVAWSVLVSSSAQLVGISYSTCIDDRLDLLRAVFVSVPVLGEFVRGSQRHCGPVLSQAQTSHIHGKTVPSLPVT